MTSNRLAVMHLLGVLRPSGMERMLLSGAAQFRQLGVDTTVVAQGRDQPFAATLAAQPGFTVRTIRQLKAPGGVSDLRRLLAKEEPDVVHVHTEGAFALAVLAVSLRDRRRGRPVIVRTVHNIFPHEGGRAGRSRRIQGRLVDGRVDAFLAPSPDVASSEAAMGRRARVIYNWVDDRFYDNARASPTSRSDGITRAIIVGNASPIKNHALALRALCSDPTYELAYFGSEACASAEEVSLLDRLAQEGRLRSRSEGDPLEALDSSDVFLMPSRYEGMGVALGEAIAMGVPAVINDVPGLTWAKGIPGVLSLPDDAEAWQTALRGRFFIGVGGNAVAPDFRAERGVKEYVDVYTHLIEKSRYRGRRRR